MAGSSHCPRCDRPVAAETCPDCGGPTQRRPQVRTTAEDRPFLEDEDPRRPEDIEWTVAPTQDGSLVGIATHYPLTDGRRPVVLGTIMLALAPLVVPLVCLWGYCAHVARAAARGDDAVPSVDAWGLVLTSGAFTALALAPLLVGGGVLLLVAATTATVLGEAGSTLGVAVLVSVVLATGYLAAALLVTLAGTGGARAAFANKRFLRVAANPTFIVSLLGLVAVLAPPVAGLVLASLVLSLSVVGLPVLAVVWLLGLSYATLASAAWAGLVARRLAAAGLLEPVYEQESLELTV